MKVKLDENLPGRVQDVLIERGHEATTALQEGLGGRNDDAVASAAASEGRLIITLDRRFADIRRYQAGSHPGIVVLRPSESATAQPDLTIAGLASPPLPHHHERLRL